MFSQVPDAFLRAVIADCPGYLRLARRNPIRREFLSRAPEYIAECSLRGIDTTTLCEVVARIERGDVVPWY